MMALNVPRWRVSAKRAGRSRTFYTHAASAAQAKRFVHVRHKGWSATRAVKDARGGARNPQGKRALWHATVYGERDGFPRLVTYLEGDSDAKIVERAEKFYGVAMRPTIRHRQRVTSGNPDPFSRVTGRTSVKLIGFVERIEYVHADDAKRYRHEFGAKVQLQGLPDGSLRIWKRGRKLYGNY